MVKVLQLNVEVSTCQLPTYITNQYGEYLLTVALSTLQFTLDQELTASTSWKAPDNRCVDFSTRLFIRLDKTNLELTPDIQNKAILTLTGLTQGRTKVVIATGEVASKIDGPHRVELKVEGKT